MHKNPTRLRVPSLVRNAWFIEDTCSEENQDTLAGCSQSRSLFNDNSSVASLAKVPGGSAAFDRLAVQRKHVYPTGAGGSLVGVLTPKKEYRETCVKKIQEGYGRTAPLGVRLC